MAKPSADPRTLGACARRCSSTAEQVHRPAGWSDAGKVRYSDPA